ncbi:MAG: ArsR family transcriptional regulator [Methanothrix sp.]|nr:ArsR family transcriptional regulator [Methanothrix sp.]
MRLKRSEICALIYVLNSGGVTHPRDIARKFGLRPETVSRMLSHLEDAGLVKRKRDGRRIALPKSEPAESFKRLYYTHRASPLTDILRGRRIALIHSLDRDPKGVSELSGETGIPAKTLYFHLKDLIRLGIARKIKNKGMKGFLYSFNYTLWADLKSFVTALLEHEARQLLPEDAVLIKIYSNSILFRSQMQLDATPTSFSVYEQHGIDLGVRDYYTLPKRELSIRDVFIHSLDSAESISHRLYCILFYLKYRDDLSDIRHPAMRRIRAALRGVHVRGYPSLDEVKTRAVMYEIES